MEDKFFKNYIKYETRMMQIFKELQLKPNQCQLIRAFLIVSDGKTEFEASFSELEALTNKKGKDDRKTNTVRHALKTILEWQDKNQIELIRVLQKGRQITGEDGKFNYQKSKYKLILLNNLATVLHTDSERFEAVFDELISKIREEYKPAEKGRKHHPLHKLKIARKTIETKIRRVFELSKEAGLNPIIECKRVLNKALNVFRGLEIEDTDKANREQFITEFETLLGWSEIDEDLEEATQ